MDLGEDQCWARLVAARHGVLATVHPRRGVDAVPVVFALSGEPGRTIVIPIDTVKPKRSGHLQRVANIEGDARCVLMVDHYEDEWSRLWWVRVHGVAAVGDVTEDARVHLAARYRQYRQAGAVVGVIALTPSEVVGWCASPPPFGQPPA